MQGNGTIRASYTEKMHKRAVLLWIRWFPTGQRIRPLTHNLLSLFAWVGASKLVDTLVYPHLMRSLSCLPGGSFRLCISTTESVSRWFLWGRICWALEFAMPGTKITDDGKGKRLVYRNFFSLLTLTSANHKISPEDWHWKCHAAPQGAYCLLQFSTQLRLTMNIHFLTSKSKNKPVILGLAAESGTAFLQPRSKRVGMS